MGGGVGHCRLDAGWFWETATTTPSVGHWGSRPEHPPCPTGGSRTAGGAGACGPLAAGIGKGVALTFTPIAVASSLSRVTPRDEATRPCHRDGDRAAPLLRSSPSLFRQGPSIRPALRFLLVPYRALKLREFSGRFQPGRITPIAGPKRRSDLNHPTPRPAVWARPPPAAAPKSLAVQHLDIAIRCPCLQPRRKFGGIRFPSDRLTGGGDEHAQRSGTF